MIILLESASDRMVFTNVTRIEEMIKPSLFNEDGRKVVNLFSGEKVLAGGDDIDLMTNKLTILPNAEIE